LKVKLIGYLLFLVGYLENSYKVTQLCPYIFYITLAILIGYPLILMIFVTLCLDNNGVFQKKYPKSSLSVSLINTVDKGTFNQTQIKLKSCPYTCIKHVFLLHVPFKIKL